MATHETVRGETSHAARRRRKVAISGSRRVEVTVSPDDAPLVRAVAGALRAGGEEARRVRESLGPLLSVAKARTGRELVAFFRSSPLVGVELSIDRARSTGRSADLG